MSSRLLFVLPLVESSLYVIILLCACTYSLPILCIRRLQHRNNIFTLNVCLAMILSSLVCLVQSASPLFGYSYSEFLEDRLWLRILQSIFILSLVLSFGLVSFHRCCSIVFHRTRFFRTRRWMMVCLVSQWMLAMIVYIPVIIFRRPVRLTAIDTLDVSMLC